MAWRSTVRRGISFSSSCRRSRTGAATTMAAARRSGCGLPARSWRACAADRPSRDRRLQAGRGGVHGGRAWHRAAPSEIARSLTRRGLVDYLSLSPGQLQHHRNPPARPALADPGLSGLPSPVQVRASRRPDHRQHPHPGTGAGRARTRGGRGGHDRHVPCAHGRSRMAEQGASGRCAGHSPLHRLQPVLGLDLRRRADRLRDESDAAAEGTSPRPRSDRAE